jgi:hypothetical protein
MIFDMPGNNKAQARIAEYAKSSVDYTMVSSIKGDTFFLLTDYEFKVEEGLSSIDATTKTTVVDAHAFIEITIGKRAFSLQMCLLEASQIRAIKFLLNKTVDPKDGRFGSKEMLFVVPIQVIDAHRMTAFANVDLRHYRSNTLLCNVFQNQR